MKMIKLTQDVANAVLERLSLLKNNTNKVRLVFGLKNAGAGITCMARIVDGMRMEEIGFLTNGVPSDYVDGEVYASCIVKAKAFCDYLSAFNSFNADVVFGVSDKLLSLAVEGQANVSLECVSEADAEPLFVDDSKTTMAVFTCSGNVLNDALKMGGFCAVTSDDPSMIADRVVLSFDASALYVYSTDSEHARVTSSTAQIKASFNDALRAACFLKNKVDSLNGEAKAQLLEKVSKTPKQQLVDVAKAEGFDGSTFDIAVPTSSIQIVQKLIAGAEKIEVAISQRYLRIRCGNVLASFLLADICPTIYKTVLPNMEKVKWEGTVVVDKEQFVNALNIIQLSADSDNYPFSFSVDTKQGKVVMKDNSGNSTLCNLVSSSCGDSIDSLVKYMKASNFASVLSKYPNGNIVICINGKKNSFMQVRNGELDGKNVTSKTYLIEINVDKNREAMAKKEAKEEEKAIAEADGNNV